MQSNLFAVCLDTTESPLEVNAVPEGPLEAWLARQGALVRSFVNMSE